MIEPEAEPLPEPSPPPEYEAERRRREEKRRNMELAETYIPYVFLGLCIQNAKNDIGLPTPGQIKLGAKILINALQIIDRGEE